MNNSLTPLAQTDIFQRVDLLPNTRVNLVWRWLEVEMRMSDLLVLRNELVDQSDITSSATVWLNDCPLHLSEPDYYEFRDLVLCSAEKLPRQIVRWADLKVKIEVHNVGFHNGATSYSLN